MERYQEVIVALAETVMKCAYSALCGGLTMTSKLACNKTSLFRKLYIPDKKLLWNDIRKSWSLFQHP